LGADLTTQGRFLSVSPDGHWLGIGLSDGFRLIARPLDVAALQRARTVRFRHGPSNVTFFFSFAWMPDSRRVVFSGREGGNDPQLWVGDSASGTAQPLGGSSEWELLPAVSRNGTVAYASTPMDWDILQVALDSPRLQPLVTGTRDDSWPSWVPRTNELVFTTSREGHFEIWKRHLAGVTEQVLVTPGMFPDGPTLFLAASSVSPNGEQLAFTRYGTGGIRIYFQALQGKAPVRLTNADAQAAREDNPAWSPNSKWIVFRSGPRVLKAPATAGAVPITVATDSVPISLTAVPKWVGDEIIYQSPEGLRRVPETGGSPTTLSSLQPLVWDPEPGGTILAILKGEGAAMVLVRIDMRSGAVIKRFPDLGRVPLTPDPLGYARTIRSLRVSPDGKRVALAYLNPRSDIWILEGLR
jgi:dipeptidyl aminopeptidase/acylaminoacyl peptidase